jgi:hypothetical protein
MGLRRRTSQGINGVSLLGEIAMVVIAVAAWNATDALHEIASALRKIAEDQE